MSILIVGAGLAGATAARLLAEAGKCVLVIDSRDHIAGNAYDFINELGILEHKYGPHLFHTNNEDVFNFLSRFTGWVPYRHKVKALLEDGTYVTLPVNRETAETVGKDNILDVLFRPYTKKMWGVELDELDPSIINRIPMRDDDSVVYFPNDKYQFMPAHGYTEMVESMLNHLNITVHLDTVFTRDMGSDFDHIFSSAPIDEYYEFEHGELPYRSIKFHTHHLPTPRMLPTTTVNFTHDGKYTRMTEWKLIPNSPQGDKYHTSVTFEEPCDYRDNDNQRFYPVKDMAGINRELYKKYADIKDPRITFIGRCGLYVYLDMDMAVASTMAAIKRYLA